MKKARQPRAVRPARAEDARELAPHLRAADLREISAASGEEPTSLLERGIAHSDPCYAVEDEEGAALALFGVVPDATREGTGIVWLLASDDLVAARYTFLKHCRQWVERLHERYAVLWNCVDARNEAHLRWLRWCGFTLMRLVEDYGVEHRPFYEFVRTRVGGEASVAAEAPRESAGNF
ncbi:MAG TPA: hypothetical protein VGB73_02080 [Pyrinomonadaceae bacterium]|jgi:hypothetical protein